jgi:hypothetical protein
MGWGLIPPEPTEASIIATAQAMAEVAEYAIIQQAVPWERLFAGEELDELVAETKGLAYFLEALGLEMVFLLDPLDGLDRTSEPPELTEAGRSILEPEIRAIHESYALAIAREIRPAYFGLASEINTLAAHGDPVAVRGSIGETNWLGTIEGDLEGTTFSLAGRASRSGGEWHMPAVHAVSITSGTVPELVGRDLKLWGDYVSLVEPGPGAVVDFTGRLRVRYPGRGDLAVQRTIDGANFPPTFTSTYEYSGVICP